MNGKDFEMPRGITNRLRQILEDDNVSVTEVKFDFPLDRGGIEIHEEKFYTPYGTGYVKHAWNRSEKKIVINAKIEITETQARYLGILK